MSQLTEQASGVGEQLSLITEQLILTKAVMSETGRHNHFCASHLTLIGKAELAERVGLLAQRIDRTAERVEWLAQRTGRTAERLRKLGWFFTQ